MARKKEEAKKTDRRRITEELPKGHEVMPVIPYSPKMKS